MADGKTYIVPTKEEPTFWNKEAFLGTFLLPIPVVGTVVGGLVGKARMEREKEYGKPIDPPSAWNKDTLIGAIVSAIVAAVPAGIGALVGGMIGAAAGPAGAVLGLFAGATIGAGATVIGGTLYAASLGKERIRKEYDAAEALVRTRDEMNIAQGKAPGHTPSPQLSQKLSSGINGMTYAGMIAGSIAAPAVLFMGPLAGGAVWMMGEMGGAVVGGLIGKSNQKDRYAQGDVVTREEALQVEVMQRGGMAVPQRGQQISIEEAKLLEQRLAQMQGNMQDRVASLRDAPSQQSL